MKKILYILLVLISCCISYGTDYPSIDDWQESNQPNWFLAGPYQLYETNDYNMYYYSNIFAQIPDILNSNKGARYSLNTLDYIPEQWKKTEPIFYPYIQWEKNSSPSNKVGYISVKYEGQQMINCRIRSSWRCLRIDGKWRAISKGIMPGTTNFFVTFNPLELKKDQTNDLITIEIDSYENQKIPIEFEHKYVEIPEYNNKNKLWRTVEAINERPEGLMALKEHSLMMLQYCWISPVAQKSELRFGCDDAVKIWHNGAHIYTYPHSRGYIREKYIVPVDLCQGSNWFQFALINSVGIANVGARLYPYDKPLRNGIQFLDVKRGITKQNYFENWQVAGPFIPSYTNIVNDQFCIAVFKQAKILQYDAKEIKTAFGTAIWQARKNHFEMVDLNELTPEHSVLYIKCECIAPKAMAADVYFDSDDGVRIWHNDKIVFTIDEVKSYKKESNQIEVDLKAGTNTFIFCLVNVVGEGCLGAEMRQRDDYDDCYDIVQTGDDISLDFHWMQATGEKNIPRVDVCPHKPNLLMVRVIDSDNNDIYYKECEADISRDELPLKISMQNKKSGVYTVQSYWNDKCHTRSFLYINEKSQFNDTQKWWVRLMRNDDFFSQSKLLKAIGKYTTDEEFRNEFSGQMVRAYQADFDNELQPYGIVVPEKLRGTTNCPLRVILEPRYMIGKEEWSRKFIGGQPEYVDCITVIPYGCGGRIESGIAEKDVLNVINEVKRLFSIDEDRIYLEGECIGGASSWRLAGRYPDLFAGITPRGGVYPTYYKNLLHIPIWHYHGELDHPMLAQQLISALKVEKADVKISINPGAKAGSYDWDVIKEMRKWVQTKKRLKHPSKVHYGTFGDLDGAYWVRDIIPERYGRLAFINAIINTNSKNQIDVTTLNTMKFSLDLTDSLFTNNLEWSIYVDGTGPYSAKSGQKMPIILDQYILEKSPTGLTKTNGFCGGLEKIVNERFIFAYADGKNCKKNRQTAQAAKNNIQGVNYWKYDIDIRVVSDKQLTKNLCQKYNVVLFASYPCLGTFLKTNAKNLPYIINTNSVAIGGRTGNDFMCLYPNPIAQNRYLLTVMSTNYSARLLQNARFDVLLDRIPGSFDVNWDVMQWADEHHSVHKQGNNQGNLGRSRIGNNSSKASHHQYDKEPFWKKIGQIIILMIAGILMLYYGGKKVIKLMKK